MGQGENHDGRALLQRPGYRLLAGEILYSAAWLDASAGADERSLPRHTDVEDSAPHEPC
jgi:hypothetical protein